jgi:hypothetical protein
MSANTRATPPEGGRGQGNGSEHTQALILHPATGEVFTSDAIEREPPENLADLLLALREQQSKVRIAERYVADELDRRLALRERKVWIVGEFELSRALANESEWDADELERTLRELIDEGVVEARECVGIVTHETIVHRREATALLRRLTGSAERRVKACCSWKKKPRGSLSVTRSQPLIPEQ